MNDRSDGIGASEAAAACGLSHWASPLDLYFEKTGTLEPRTESEPMRWGKILEPAIIGEFRRRGYPVVVAPSKRRSVDPSTSFMFTHLDGIMPGVAVVNAKTSRTAEGWGEEGSAEAPAEYLVQSHHEMIVLGLQLAYIPVLIGGSDFRIIKVPYDRELGDFVIKAETELWQRIKERNPPTPSSLADVARLYPHSHTRELEATPEIRAAVDLLRTARANMTQAESAAESAELAIKQFLGDADTLTIAGSVAATWRSAKPVVAVDVKRLREDNPDLAKLYETERPPVRRFLLKG